MMTVTYSPYVLEHLVRVDDTVSLSPADPKGRKMIKSGMQDSLPWYPGPLTGRGLDLCWDSVGDSCRWCLQSREPHLTSRCPGSGSGW